MTSHLFNIINKNIITLSSAYPVVETSMCTIYSKRALVNLLETETTKIRFRLEAPKLRIGFIGSISVFYYPKLLPQNFWAHEIIFLPFRLSKHDGWQLEVRATRFAHWVIVYFGQFF
jgi:hypothetical protein